jgi:putative membrane protein
MASSEPAAAASTSSSHASSAPTQRPFYGQPFMWLLFALALLLLPIIGYMLQADMTWNQAHPAVNAMLNGSSAVFLIAGYVAIRRIDAPAVAGAPSPSGAPGRGRNIAFHRSCMITAFATSTLFLASYLARFYLSGTHRYPGDGADKIAYLLILFSHMVLAAVALPMVLRTLYLAWRRRFDDHRRLARWTWPIWIYVSITGVAVYLMLYPIAGALYGS